MMIVICVGVYSHASGCQEFHGVFPHNKPSLTGSVITVVNFVNFVMF